MNFTLHWTLPWDFSTIYILMIKIVNDYKKMKAVIFPGFRDAN